LAQRFVSTGALAGGIPKMTSDKFSQRQFALGAGFYFGKLETEQAKMAIFAK